MDIQEQIAVIVHTISHQGGRIDALNSTLLSMPVSYTHLTLPTKA